MTRTVIRILLGCAIGLMSWHVIYMAAGQRKIRRAERAMTRAADAVVLDVYSGSARCRTAVYEYRPRDYPARRNAVTYDPEKYGIKKGDRFTVRYDPGCPDCVRVPAIENGLLFPHVPNEYLAAQALRLFAIAVAVALAQRI